MSFNEIVSRNFGKPRFSIRIFLLTNNSDARSEDANVHSRI